MRAVAFSLVLGATACATATPSELSGPINTEAEPAPTDTEAAAIDEPAPAPGAQRFVGLRSPDLLLEAPKPLLPRGERILDGTSRYGLVALGIEGGNELIFLDRRTEQGDFIVEAVLELPAGVTWKQVAWDDCQVDGKPDSQVVAIVAADAGCEPLHAPAISAWRADPEAGQFKIIAPETIRCPPPTCEQTNDTGVMVGGVVGSVVGSDSAD